MKLIQTVKRRMGADDSKAKASGSKNSATHGHSPGSAVAGEGKAPGAQFASLPKLRDAPAMERSDLFRRKMEVCSVVFDFTNDSNNREKEAKRETLLEMIEYVNNTRNCINEALMQNVVNMVSANIFRALQTKKQGRTDVLGPRR